MKTFSPAMGSRLLSSVFLTVIVGSLCFSVGEGLRLTPFPVSMPAEVEEAHLWAVNTSDKSSLSQYGPLDVPPQNQKRSKRSFVDLAGPTAAASRYVVPELSSLFEYESTDVTPVLFVTRPAGRAPPFLF